MSEASVEFDLDDPRWNGLQGGYRLPYDPRPSLRALEADPSNESAWSELWENLHHQGDVGEASYAALVALVKIHQRAEPHGWNFLALAATIETERHASRNPIIPPWLLASYRSALSDLLEIALKALRVSPDPLVLQSALAVAALARGQTKLGALLGGLDESELDEWVEDQLAWSETYRNGE